MAAPVRTEASTFTQRIAAEPVPGWLLALLWLTTRHEPSPASVRLRAIGWAFLLVGGWTLLALLLILWLGRFFAFWVLTLPLLVLWLGWCALRLQHRSGAAAQ